MFISPARRRTRVAGTAWVVAVAVFAGLLAACTGGGSGDGASTGGASRSGAPTSRLRVLAGSEVKDLEPILRQAQQETGVQVELTYAGTLEAAEQIANGSAAKSHDAVWFSSNRYLSLVPGGTRAIAAEHKTMVSPVVLGVKESTAKRLGWDTTAPTWAQIAAAAGAKKFTYGMTNPASSNSGFSALVGVATALAGGGSALDEARTKAVAPKLTQFFAGQTLTSGSSGWLADRFTAQDGAGPRPDALVNYESVLLGLRASGRLPEQLTIVYPKDGVVTADYPLTLLSGAGQAPRAGFEKLTTWLRSPQAQKLIMDTTWRRPAVPGVPLRPEFGQQLLVELPFPARRAVADGLISAYLNEFRRPSQTIYVLDVSGSMRGQRLDSLKAAFRELAGRGGATGATGGFATFRAGERVTLLPFSSTPRPPTVFEVPRTDPEPVLTTIDTQVQALAPDAETAIFDSLRAAYDVAQQQVAAHPDTFTSIVLMTDGEQTAGGDFVSFATDHGRRPDAVRAVPTFSILFGEANEHELDDVADLTGGKVFDARASSLAQAFKEIRGYQ